MVLLFFLGFLLFKRSFETYGVVKYKPDQWTLFIDSNKKNLKCGFVAQW